MTRTRRLIIFAVSFAIFVLTIVVVMLVVHKLSEVQVDLVWSGTGKVTLKEYDDPDDWDTHSSTCWSTDKYGNCTFRTYETTHHHDPAHWYVDVSDPFWGGNHRMEVAEVTYNRCAEGKPWTRNECPS